MDRKDLFIYFTVVWGMLEILLFCGCVYGWASLVYVYKNLGYFSDLCPNISNSLNVTTVLNSSLNTADCIQQSCSAQDNQFSLIFTMAVVFTGAMCVINGFMFDKLGTRFCRLYAIAVTFTGYLFLILASKDQPYFLYPGLLLMSYGAYIILICNFQLGNLVPKYRSTILALYCGAYDCSAAIYLLFKIAYENGFSLRNCFIVQTCLFSMVIISSFTIMPKYKYFGPNDYTFHLAFFKRCCQKRDEKSDTDIVKEATLPLDDQLQDVYDPFYLTRSREAMTAINHVPSISSLHQRRPDNFKLHYSLADLNSLSTPIVRWTSSTNNSQLSLRSKQMHELEPLRKNRSLNAIVQSGRANHDEIDCGIARSNRKFPSDLNMEEKSPEEGDGAIPKPKKESHQRITFRQNLISPIYFWILTWIALHRFRSWFFISVFNPWISTLADSCTQVSFYTSIFAALQFFGIFTATLSGRLMDRESSRKFSNLRYERMYSAIPTFVLTCSIGLLLSITCTIPVIQVQPVTFALHTLHRSFVYGPNTAFIAITFPFEHFGKLLGISLTVSALFSLLQYPVILIIQGPLHNNPFAVNIALITAMCITYVLPYYVWRYLSGKRRHVPETPIVSTDDKSLITDH